MTMAHACSAAWGAVLVLFGGGLILTPAGMRNALLGLPRNVWWARLLTAAALAWSAWLLYDMPLGWFDAHKKWLWAAAPAVWWMIDRHMPELLAARAVGGLLLLAANPVLDAVRWLDTPWRLSMVVAAYVWVVAGMTLVAAPYWFRRMAAWLTGTPFRARAAGGVLALLGITQAVIGVLMF